MPAYFDSGFLVSKPAWHGLGTLLKDAPTIQEGIVQAGADWTVSTREAKTLDGLAMQTRAVVRDTDNKILGEVGPDYVPLQNSKAFDWFQPFLDAGQAELHTGGVLHGGEVVWVLAKLKRNNAVIRHDDEIGKFLMLSNGHNGKMSVRIGFTPIRVVCANTLALAHTDKASQMIRIRHRGNVEKNILNVRETVDAIDAAFVADVELYTKLANNSNINAKDLRKYVKVVLEVREDVPDADLSTKIKNIIENIIRRFETGMGNKGESWWDAYNAVTEYLSYERGHNADNRLDSLWYGPGATLNKFALNKALEFAQGKV
jgi:phage/plasmid-like protein (TIGR03299 family)